jgi:hypothetical protein
VLSLGHSNVLSNGSIAYFREDHFSGGRPIIRKRISGSICSNSLGRFLFQKQRWSA